MRGRPRRRAAALGAGLLLPMLSVAAPYSARAATDGRVDASKDLGVINRELLGLAHNAHSTGVEDLLRTRVPNLQWMRVDTFFDDATVRVGEGTVTLDPRAIDARLASVAASGAQALLILDYMPPAMAEPVCANAARIYPGTSRCPPADYGLWRELVRQAVRHACCETNVVSGLPNVVRWFEVWNEPDFIGFFAGTLPDYLRIYQSSNEALRAVEDELGTGLYLGGGAFLVANPVWIHGLLGFVAASGLDLDFLSWHYYANYPLFGQFPTLTTTPDEDNPLLGAGVYFDQTEQVRAMAEPYKAFGVDPLLWINEWNINAGADDRHDTAYAAAFTAASLHAMQDAGLDRSCRFNTQDDVPSPFLTWGMFNHSGKAKPVFHAFQMWDHLERRQVEAIAPLLPRLSAPGAGPHDRRYRFGAVASRSEDLSRITMLLYNFAPYREREVHAVRTLVEGLPAAGYTETVYLADNEHVRLGDSELVPVRGPRPVTLPGALDEIVLQPNSVALIELTL